MLRRPWAEGAALYERTRPARWLLEPGQILARPKAASKARNRSYLAVTEVTVTLSPSTVPTTVAILPACLSKVASAALSEVSRV